ncbi:MAG: hypothetical protein WCP19_11030 [Chloroflexota bacterium]
MTVMNLLVIVPLVGLFAVLSIGPDLFGETEDRSLVQKHDGKKG